MRVGAGEALLHLAALADRPGEVRFDGRRRFVDVVAVEAEARFEAQAVARAEADGRDVRVGEQHAREGGRDVARDGDFVAVLAGVAGARDEERARAPT